jgi:plasmid rolling circle replication initiator protein Rep
MSYRWQEIAKDYFGAVYGPYFVSTAKVKEKWVWRVERANILLEYGSSSNEVTARRNSKAWLLSWVEAKYEPLLKELRAEINQRNFPAEP